jgi:hypothetical protein
MLTVSPETKTQMIRRAHEAYKKELRAHLARCFTASCRTQTDKVNSDYCPQCRAAWATYEENMID